MSRYHKLEELKEQLKKGAPAPEQKKPEPAKEQEPEAARQEPAEQPEAEADDKPKRKKKVVEQE